MQQSRLAHPVNASKNIRTWYLLNIDDHVAMANPEIHSLLRRFGEPSNGRIGYPKHLKPTKNAARHRKNLKPKVVSSRLLVTLYHSGMCERSEQSRNGAPMYSQMARQFASGSSRVL
jgi:hypothetical protein